MIARDSPSDQPKDSRLHRPLAGEHHERSIPGHPGVSGMSRSRHVDGDIGTRYHRGFTCMHGSRAMTHTLKYETRHEQDASRA